MKQLYFVFDRQIIFYIVTDRMTVPIKHNLQRHHLARNVIL